MQIKIKKINGGKLPEYKTIGSAGADCFARLQGMLIIGPGQVVTIPLGFAVEIPDGFELQVRGRSGLARKNSVQVFNSPGTIDSDYRGEVGAILYNASAVDFIVEPNDRIAQAIIAPVIRAEWKETNELSETERGVSGFGSTGVSEKIVKKFYEPFKTYTEVENMLGREVVIDDKDAAIVNKVSISDTFIYVDFLLENSPDKTVITMYLTKAFERVKIDGHRFGREIKGDEND